jgi:hypothetical protein
MSSLARKFSTILFPVELNQTIRGSVSVLEPDPSDRGDVLISSCKASDAAMNTESLFYDWRRPPSHHFLSATTGQFLLSMFRCYLQCVLAQLAHNFLRNVDKVEFFMSTGI